MIIKPFVVYSETQVDLTEVETLHNFNLSLTIESLTDNFRHRA